MWKRFGQVARSAWHGVIGQDQLLWEKAKSSPAPYRMIQFSGVRREVADVVADFDCFYYSFFLSYSEDRSHGIRRNRDPHPSDSQSQVNFTFIEGQHYE
jgi:hypothetical protein